MNTPGSNNYYLAEVWLKGSNPAGNTELRRFADLEVAQNWASERVNEPDATGKAEIAFIHGRNGKVDVVWSLEAPSGN